MLIFTKDRKRIVECSSISVSKSFGGGKDAKFVLSGSGITGLDAAMLAAYPDEKTAMDELEKLFTAFENGAAAYRL